MTKIQVEPAMSSHPCDTGKMAFKHRWLLIGGTFVYKIPFWGMAKWPPVGGWLLMRKAAHSRFYCIPFSRQVIKFNFHPLVVVCRYHEPQLQVGENY